MIDISVIITSYNAQDTIQRAILSVLDTVNRDKIEIIVVDDCSNDDTLQIIKNIAEQYNNVKFEKLKKNSGSPSTPRNVGIESANGQYITFLDDDDEINADNLLDMVNYAKKHDLDVIKGYLKVIRGNEIVEMGKIECDNNDSLKVIRNIISNQSTTTDIIIKKDVLIKNKIRFNKNYKVGEDTLFYADVFATKPKIEYYNSFFLYYHKRTDVRNPASTQRYQDKELNNHIDIWTLVEKKFNKIGLSYYNLRLPIAIKNMITSIIFYSHGKISKKSFSRLSEFINNNIDYSESNFNLHRRYQEVLNAIIENDYEKFLDVSKKRILITGNDLKFIKPVLNYLKDDYNIKIDEWIGHNIHDEQKSVELLNWADFIFCEWLLGNSVWYSDRKMNHQKLIIRAHKFELTREFGNQVNYANVDGVIAVSYYYLELFAKTFGIPREKMILLSNYVETIYRYEKTSDYRNNIAIVGYIPRWKGLLKGLKILEILKKHDKKFKLYLMGKNYKDVEWVWNNPEERSYFEECENFIKDHDLEDSVIFKGWVERIDMFTNIGYVLSVSDIESFHLAPAEGLFDLTLAFLLNWDGVEYVYPEDIICSDINDITEKILSTYNNDYKYYQLLKEMRDYVMTEFNVEKFVSELKLHLERISLN